MIDKIYKLYNREYKISYELTTGSTVSFKYILSTNLGELSTGDSGNIYNINELETALTSILNESLSKILVHKTCTLNDKNYEMYVRVININDNRMCYGVCYDNTHYECIVSEFGFNGKDISSDQSVNEIFRILKQMVSLR